MSTIGEALRFYQNGDWEEAARRLRIVVEFDRENVQAWMYYGAALGQLHRWPQASEAFRHVVDLRPEEASGYVDLGTAALEAGYLDRADDAIRAALQLEPKHPVALALRERLKAMEPEPAAAPPSEPAATAAPDATLPAPTRTASPRRLRALVAVLVILLAITGVKLCRQPGAKWRRLAEAEKLLDHVDVELARLAHFPGEDFPVISRIRAAQDKAESRLQAVLRVAPDVPETYFLRARLRWTRDRDGLDARNDLLHGLGLLSGQPVAEQRPSGRTVGQLQATAYRLMCDLDLAAAGGANTAEVIRRAQGYLDKARALDPATNDQARAEAVRRASQPVPASNQPATPAR